ncbi:MAG TPA: GDSL-type esterase/lipase family protein, partial [Anaerolineales bacterium]|nr:GDSL-type esterase/lipase family protein [Anaerolineales bacterium]
MMKRIILFLSFFLMACSQELISTLAPNGATDDAQTTLTPVATLPGGPVTLVALGDSLTQGDGDDSGRGYTGRLLEKVNVVRPGSLLSNFGQSGWNSDALIGGDQGLTGQLERAIGELEDAKSQGRASVALVWIGSNDLWYLYEFGEGSDENDSLDAEHFESNMNVI